MKIEFTGRHIEVTPALRAHVEEHFDRIEHLFDGKPAKAHVIIEVERGRHRSEIVINWRNEVLTAATSLAICINRCRRPSTRSRSRLEN